MSVIKKTVLIFLILFTALLMLIFFVGPSSFIEIVYSCAIYKVLIFVISNVSGLFPFSLAELLIACLVAVVIFNTADFAFKTVVVIAKKISGYRHFSLFATHYSFKRILLNFCKRVIVLFVLLFTGFYVLWGMNYNREVFQQSRATVSTDVLVDLCKQLIAKNNLLRQSLPDRYGDYSSYSDYQRSVFMRAQSGYDRITDTYPKLKGRFGRPKPIMASKLLSYTGITGIYFPFTGEANVNICVPMFTLPFTTSHEMAHQRGYAREDEANFIAYLACDAHPDNDFKYSGNMLALMYCADALIGLDVDAYKSVASGYSEKLKEDLTYNREFWIKYSGNVEKLFSEINNTYLKANNQTDGIKSYGMMVELLVDKYMSER